MKRNLFKPKLSSFSSPTKWPSISRNKRSILETSPNFSRNFSLIRRFMATSSYISRRCASIFVANSFKFVRIVENISIGSNSMIAKVYVTSGHCKGNAFTGSCKNFNLTNQDFGNNDRCLRINPA